jgi:hypothetical protein
LYRLSNHSDVVTTVLGSTLDGAIDTVILLRHNIFCPVAWSDPPPTSQVGIILAPLWLAMKLEFQLAYGKSRGS